MQTPPNCNVCFLPAARPDSCFLNEYRGCFKILQVFGSAKGANDLPLIKVKGCTPNRKGCETGKTRHLNNCLESIRIEEKGLRTDFHPSASHFRKRRHVRVNAEFGRTAKRRVRHHPKKRFSNIARIRVEARQKLIFRGETGANSRLIRGLG